MAGTEDPIKARLVSKGRTPKLGYKKGGWVLENQSMKIKGEPTARRSALNTAFTMCCIRSGLAPDRRWQMRRTWRHLSVEPTADSTNQSWHFFTLRIVMASESFTQELQTTLTSQLKSST